MEAIAAQMLDKATAHKAAQSPVLDIDFHLPILRRWGVGMAERANVPEHHLYTSCSDYVGPRAVDYMKKQSKAMKVQKGGFVITKTKGIASPVDACASMVAASFRQMRTGRVLLLKELLLLVKNNETPDIAMIAVPDFFDASLPLSTFEQGLVMHFLNSQYLHCKGTVLFVSSMKELRKAYGEKIYEHLTTSYVIE